MDIERDSRRFKQIVRGRIRENLKKYVTHGEMIGRQGGDLVSIPIPQLEVPRFRFGKNGSSGVGQGAGEVGDPVGNPGDGPAGQGGAGSEPGGGHLLEVDVSIDELADILGEELELPRIEPKGVPKLVAEKTKYNSIRPTGPESLRHFRKTYLRAMRRQISAGVYQPDDPRVIPVKSDKQYRSWNDVVQPQTNAAVIYMMDVSGSMSDEQKAIVRTEAFWIDAWLGRQYKGLEKRYIIHDATAKEVDEHTFYRTRESGGTRISSAYQLAAQIMDESLSPQDWNLYCFQFSDGDNWGDDNRRAFELLKEQILPAVNLFCYGQVESAYGSGEFYGALVGEFGDNPAVVATEIAGREAIYESIRKFLGRGR